MADKYLVGGAVVASLGLAAVGAVYFAPRPVSSPVILVTQPSPVDASSSGKRPLGPTLPLLPSYIASEQFAVSASLGNSDANCTLDTGTSLGLAVNPLFARYAGGFVNTGTASIANVGDTAQGWTFVAPVIIGGYTMQVHGLADPAWNGQPLIGMPLLQALWPNGFALDTVHLQVRPVTTPYAVPPTYAPTLPLWLAGYRQRKELIASVRLGNATTQAVMDTGNEFAAVISPATAKAAGVRIVAGTPPYSPAGSQWFEAPVTVYRHTVTVRGVVNPAWSYIPLLGVPFWRTLYPRGWAVNLVKMRIQPL